MINDRVEGLHALLARLRVEGCEVDEVVGSRWDRTLTSQERGNGIPLPQGCSEPARQLGGFL